MPAPLLWLGAAVAGIYAGNKANESYLKHKSVVGNFPGESDFSVRASNGAIVSCGIYGVLDHTGIWLDGKIVELSGNGLVRAISPERFLYNRTGEQIYIACNADFDVLNQATSLDFCVEHLFTHREYDLIKNNCHKFVAEALTDNRLDITSFSDLNEFMSHFFQSAIYWHRLSSKDL